MNEERKGYMHPSEIESRRDLAEALQTFSTAWYNVKRFIAHCGPDLPEDGTTLGEVRGQFGVLGEINEWAWPLGETLFHEVQTEYGKLPAETKKERRRGK
jgi:hypothetical protein